MMKASEIATFLKSELYGNGETCVESVDDIKGDRENSLSFISDSSYIKYLSKTKAMVLLVQESIDTGEVEKLFHSEDRAYIVVKDAYKSFIKLIYKLIPESVSYFRDAVPKEMISPDCEISKDAVLYPGVFIDVGVRVGRRTVLFPGVVIMKNSSVGDDCIIHPNVTVYQNSTIGDRVTIGSSSVIGSDGFGYVKDDDGTMLKVPHVGGVIIEDDVEIGSNTSIDRGTIGNTLIRKGTKIDNIVQIAHNCVVGENNILCAMVGISGSTELGSNVTMGADSGTKGHIKIGDNCTITGRTSVSKDLKPGSVVKGIYPARPLAEELKVQTLVGKLPEIYQRLRKLEKERGDG